jgi:protocatechuate 3,4-dioxygenase beta subunit
MEVVMEEVKTVLFYVSGLAGLVVASLLFTGQNDQNEQIPLAEGSSLSAEVSPLRCVITPQNMALPQQTTFGDISDIRLLVNPIPPDLKRRHTAISDTVSDTTCLAKTWPQNCESMMTLPSLLMISGTVYASDCLTPLPDTLIEVWYANPESQYSYTEPVNFRGQIWTDATGRYEFAALRPGRKLGIYDTGHELLQPHLHFHVRYQDNEPLDTRVNITDEAFTITPASLPASTKRSREPADPTEPVLRVTFNIVLPIP